MKRFFVLFVMVFTMAVFLLSVEFAWAADQGDKERPATKASAGTDKDTKSKAADSTKKSGASGNKVVLKEIQIEGKIHKPQAYYLLQRSNLNIEGLELNESFVPKIVKSVEEEPF